MCALRERVHACVRSPGAVNAHRRAGEALERALEIILNGITVRLTLPAGEWRAIVRDNQFQSSGHGDLAIVIGDL